MLSFRRLRLSSALNGMTTPDNNPTMPRLDRTTYLALISAGVAATILAMLWQWYVLHEFDHAAASLPPGTEIRPMGLYMLLAVAEYGCAIVGILLLLPTTVVGWSGSWRWRWVRLAAALLVAALSFVPVLHGKSAYLLIVERRGLILEP